MASREYPFHRQKRINWRSVALGVATPLSIAAVMGAVRFAWLAKEPTAEHAADVRALRSESRAVMDTARNLHQLDSAFMQRILDATCADRQNVRACRP